MRIVSTAWISNSLAEFEAACCLKTHASLGLATHNNPLEIYILQGYEKLTEQFIAPLAERHIRIYDAERIARIYLERYRQLFEILGPQRGTLYEVFCFIRWLVLQDLFAGEAFLHIDLDLFFQRSFDTIAGEFDGAAGTFGSPCLTATGGNWLPIYHAALDRLVVDRASLQAELNYGGNEFNGDISSDQDLVHAMEQADKMPRHCMAELSNRYQVFINPLQPYEHRPDAPIVCEVVDGEDHIAGKPVLFWHLQNNFADYLSRYAVVRDYEQTPLGSYLPVRLGYPFIQLMPSAENFAFQALREQSWDRIRTTLANDGDVDALGREKFFARTWISDWFILRKGGREIFTDQYWWEAGLFVNRHHASQP